MQKTITKAWLEKRDACSEGIEWFLNQNEREPIKIIQKLMKEDLFDWANWLIVRLMEYKQYVSYAVYAAEQVLDIYEKKYPDDIRPRNAIKAAKACVKNNTKKNRAAAWAAGDAAWDAARAAAVAARDAAWDAARAARDAARAARDAAWDAAWDAARDAGDAARAAAWDAAGDAARAARAAAWDAARAAAGAAGDAMRQKILNYGIKLLTAV